jgi:ubiquinone biosynthesis protein
MILSYLNLFRLFILFIFFLPCAFFSKKWAIFNFLKLSGPAFIKLGQMLSTRSDIVGDEIASYLSSFQDKIPPFCVKKVKKILKKEFGNDFSKIFSEFDFVSTASASIAQVHKAKMGDKKVAVKILRPNIRKIVHRDIRTLRILNRVIWLFSGFLYQTFFDIANLLENVAKSELDLLREAANAQKLKEQLKDVKGFYIPEIFWKNSTSQILVIEWIDGIPFSNKKEIQNCKFDKKKIARNLIISYFEQVYNNGFFHGDMHPGNLFLLENGDIAAIDFGIMGKINKKIRIAVAEILIGFLERDYQKVAKIHIEVGLVPQDTDIDDLALAVRKIGEKIVDNDVKDIPVADILGNLIVMTKKYNLKTNNDLLLLQKTLILVEGVGLILDENLNMWEIARPWIKNWARENIGFDAKIRDFVEDCIDLAKKFVRKI